MDEETFFVPVKGCTIPESWTRLEKVEADSFFIYGSSDSGKSSLATYLSNKLDSTKILVDLDIGQANIAHPAAMGIGITDGGIISISDVEMLDGAFIGAISPTGREAKCINGVLEIKRKIDKIKIVKKVIIDSTGWVRGRRAAEYKLAKIEILEPDMVIYFGEKPAYFDFLHCETVKVDSFVVKKRDRDTRIQLRSRLYAEWMDNSSDLELNLKKLRSRSSNLFKGEKIDKNIFEEMLETKVVFAEKGQGFLNICTEEEVEVGNAIIKALKEVYGVEEVNIISQDGVRGLVAGLYMDERYRGFGIIKDIDFRSGKVIIFTSANEKINRIEFGEFRLNENFKECFVKFSL